MKRFLKIDQASNATHVGLLIARVATAVLMLTHGLPKISMLFSGEPLQFADPFGLGPAFSLGLSAFAEVICSVLVLIGFGTRLAVIPLIINMIVALVHVHGGQAFSNMELSFHFLMIYIVLLFAGSGKYSVDYLLQHRWATPALRQ